MVSNNTEKHFTLRLARPLDARVRVYAATTDISKQAAIVRLLELALASLESTTTNQPKAGE